MPSGLDDLPLSSGILIIFLCVGSGRMGGVLVRLLGGCWLGVVTAGRVGSDGSSSSINSRGQSHRFVRLCFAHGMARSAVGNGCVCLDICWSSIAF